MRFFDRILRDADLHKPLAFVRSHNPRDVDFAFSRCYGSAQIAALPSERAIKFRKLVANLPKGKYWLLNDERGFL